ncbi:MAG: molybdenum cofactor biosysynthesis protein [Verrucomicrobiota bacterium]|nr:molybdenum cofactor biosysynthesis protein [Verrucomicrobiota bacterium]
MELLPPAVKVMHLYISPGHNYFGHFGRPAGVNPIVEVPSIECITNKGIVNDRFFDYKKDYKGQITFFDYAVYEQLCVDFGVTGIPPSVFRRNVITLGVDLNSLIGETFVIQGVQFKGTEEAKPCHWMNQAFAEGAEKKLKGFGGLRAQVLSDGSLSSDSLSA